MPFFQPLAVWWDNLAKLEQIITDSIIGDNVFVKAGEFDCLIVVKSLCLVFQRDEESLIPDWLFSSLFYGVSFVLLSFVLELGKWIHLTDRLRVSDEFSAANLDLQIDLRARINEELLLPRQLIILVTVIL